MTNLFDPRPFPGTATSSLTLDFGSGSAVDASEAATISIANTMRGFNVPRYAAVDALVCLRTALHNEYVAQLDEVGVASLCADVGADRETFEAALAAMLREIDANDDVLVRLDPRVADGVPERVPVVSDLDRRSIALEAAAGLSAQDAAWHLLVALPRGGRALTATRPRFEAWAQLDLPFGPPVAPTRATRLRPRRLRPLVNCAATRAFAGSFRLSASICVCVRRPRPASSTAVKVPPLNARLFVGGRAAIP